MNRSAVIGLTISFAVIGSLVLLVKLTDTPNCKHVEVREVDALRSGKYGSTTVKQKYKVCLD